MASDPAQLAAQIRFALERLSERNAQHEWEQVCRHFTRARICSNILPATGPVQSGGDQGRDFETFRTYLSHSPLAGHSFVGLIADKPIAFACTLEKRVEAKVRSDVKTIMAGGTASLPHRNSGSTRAAAPSRLGADAPGSAAVAGSSPRPGGPQPGAQATHRSDARLPGR